MNDPRALLGQQVRTQVADLQVADTVLAERLTQRVLMAIADLPEDAVDEAGVRVAEAAELVLASFEETLSAPSEEVARQRATAIAVADQATTLQRRRKARGRELSDLSGRELVRLLGSRLVGSRLVRGRRHD